MTIKSKSLHGDKPYSHSWILTYEVWNFIFVTLLLQTDLVIYFVTKMALVNIIHLLSISLSHRGSASIFWQDSLLALNKLRKEVDLEKRRAEMNDPNHQKDLEVCVRARNNAWIIARLSRGNELYIVLDKANETILFASEAVEKFSNR